MKLILTRNLAVAEKNELRDEGYTDGTADRQICCDR